MGRWLDALRKRENAPDANLQKYQKPDLASFDTFETAGFADLQKNPDPEKILKTAPDGAAKTDNSAETSVLPVLSVSFGSDSENHSDDQCHAPAGQKGKDRFLSVTSSGKRQRRDRYDSGA